MSNDLDFMTVAEVARTIRRTPRYVRGLIKDERLEATRIGERGHYLVRRSALEAFLFGTSRKPRQHSPDYHYRRAAAAGASLGYGPPGVRNPSWPVPAIRCRESDDFLLACPHRRDILHPVDETGTQFPNEIIRLSW